MVEHVAHHREIERGLAELIAIDTEGREHHLCTFQPRSMPINRPMASALARRGKSSSGSMTVMT